MGFLFFLALAPSRVYTGNMSTGFPKDFLWGASTSAYQVEGGNFNSDWSEWEASGKSERCGEACDHYNRYTEDFALAKKLGHNAHRLGLEWSRLEKEEGVWDEKEWDHYKKVLDELIRLDIEPVLTINHFTVPQWLSRKGSWLSHDSAVYFSRFSQKAAKELSSRVKYWITINEPNILALLAYYTGEWPPQHKDFREVVEVSKNMLLGHTSSYEKMKEEASRANQNPMIGLAKAVTAFHPSSRLSILDHASTFLRKKYYNHSFINSLIRGQMELPGMHGKKLSSKRTIDFIGLNYYFRQFIKHAKPFKENPFGEVTSFLHRRDAGKATDMGWEVYPRGIYEVIDSFRKYRLPLMITENGIATRKDQVRVNYIEKHLKEVLRAINKGADVIGYLHWSLLDNFEWAEGYTKKFGLINVDFKSQKRTVRPSGEFLKKIIQTGKL